MSTLTNCEVSPVILQGANIALQMCDIDIPVVKIDLKLHAKKTDITSTASYQASTQQVFEEYASGALGGNVSWDCQWRVSQVVKPPDLIPGRIYPCKAFARRAGTASPEDPGIFWSFNAIIEDSSLSLDPRTGVITWKVTASCTGIITMPTSY